MCCFWKGMIVWMSFYFLLLIYRIVAFQIMWSIKRTIWCTKQLLCLVSGTLFDSHPSRILRKYTTFCEIVAPVSVSEESRQHSYYMWGWAKGQTIGFYCPQPYPTFLQEVVSNPESITFKQDFSFYLFFFFNFNFNFSWYCWLLILYR